MLYKIIVAGALARQVLTALCQRNKHTLAIAKMVYNAKAKRRRKLLDGRSSIHALVDELAKSSFRYTVHCNTNGMVELLFFAHPDSTKLARRFNSVTFMDCTYKQIGSACHFCTSLGARA